jgi:hypothetical protein
MATPRTTSAHEIRRRNAPGRAGRFLIYDGKTIYSTAAGALVLYKTDDLAREWSRLENLPPDQFDVEILATPTPTSTAPTKSEQLEFAEL